MTNSEYHADVNDAVPYWNVNVAKEKWTTECPEALKNMAESDEKHLLIRDEEFHRMSWEDVQRVINTNHLEVFKRVPSDLRLYRGYVHKIKQSHGSVMSFILKERLKWSNVKPKAAPFQSPDDIKILYNDWPYAIDSKIVHLVVWTKFELAEDLTSPAGDLTPEARQEIEEYVNVTFRQHVDPQNVGWFKNWAALKSVQAVEHFHVMLYDPEPTFVQRITNGDSPVYLTLSAKDLYD